MGLLLLLLFPFLRRVLPFILLTFRHNLGLREQGTGRPDWFIKIPLINLDPVGVAGLFANLNALKQLLLVGFKSGQVLWGKHIRWAVKAGQFGEFADELRWLHTVPDWEFRIVPVITHSRWIKRFLRISHGQLLFPRYIFRLPFFALSNAMLERLFPLNAPRLIEDLRIAERNFSRVVGLPLFNTC